MLLAADGALSLKVTSIGIPFRILSPKHGIFVNADACAFQSLLLKAVLSGEPEKFQDNLSHAADHAEISCEPGTGNGFGLETAFVETGRSSMPQCRASKAPLAPEGSKRPRWAVFRTDEKGLIWRSRTAPD